MRCRQETVLLHGFLGITWAVVVLGRRYYDVTISNSNPFMPPGDLFVFHCMVDPQPRNALIQIIKTRLEFKGTNKYFSSRPAHGPYVISNGTALLPELLAYTDRYTAQYKEDGGVTITVRKVSAEDSGVWACRVLRDEEVIGQSDELEVVVEGPITGMDIYYVAPGTSEKQSCLGPVVPPMHDGNLGRLVCAIHITNVQADYKLTLTDTDSGDEEDVSDQFFLAVGGVFGRTAEILMNTSFTMSVMSDNEFNVSHQDHGRRFSCKASLQYNPPRQQSFFLNITFAPVLATCEARELGVPMGARNVQIVCEVRSNPPPKIVWHLPNKATKISSNEDNPRYRISTLDLNSTFSSSLLIKGVKLADFGLYKMYASNAHGSAIAETTLVQTMGVSQHNDDPSRQGVRSSTGHLQFSSISLTFLYIISYFLLQNINFIY